MTFTTVSNHGDLVTEKPTLTGTNSELRYFRGAQGGALGSKVRLDMFNDLVLNIRAAALAAGITLTDRNYGDENVLRDIIRNIGSLSITAALSEGYTTTNESGPMPLIRGRSGTTEQWIPVNDVTTAERLHQGTLAFDPDLDGVTRAAGDVVTPSFAGTFSVTLKSIAANGTASDHNAEASDVGKSVYLFVNAAGHQFCRFIDIDRDQRWASRQIGSIVAVNSGEAIVEFNTLSEPEQRTRIRQIWTGNVFSGSQTLLAGMKFSDYSSIYMEIGLDRTGTDGRQVIEVPIVIFETGNWYGTQESHAADAFLRVRRTSDTGFEVNASTRNISTGLREIWGKF